MRRPRRLDFYYQGMPFCLWMEDRTGLAAFEEVFIKGEYRLEPKGSAKVIVDAGANIGVASVFFLLTYPGARLFAVEANPALRPILEKNLAPYLFASVHTCALSDADGKIDFYVHPSSSLGSSVIPRAHGERLISVPACTLGTFMRAEHIEHIDILKFDIEGAEDRMLRGVDRKKITRYIGELHADLMRASIEEIQALFDGFTVRMEPLSGKRYIMEATRKI
jgi:FkbM family methyltransferase